MGERVSAASGAPLEPEVLYERDGHVAVVTLNRPRVLNALTLPMLTRLREIFDEVNADRNVRVLLLTGAGERSFSVGFDLSDDAVPTRSDEFRAEVRSNADVFLQLWNLRVPTIAAINGYALAAGATLALACDMSVAAADARFGEPEVRHFALSPLLLMPWLTANSKLTNYLYFSGDTIDAAVAQSLGLIGSVVPAEDLRSEAMRIAQRIAQIAPYAVELMKDSLRNAYDAMGFTHAMRYHSLNDVALMSATGIPEKDELDRLMLAGDMKAFLARRDGPLQ